MWPEPTRESRSVVVHQLCEPSRARGPHNKVNLRNRFILGVSPAQKESKQAQRKPAWVSSPNSPELASGHPVPRLVGD